MNAQQLEIFRTQLLMALNMAAPAGLTFAHLLTHVKLNGFPKATEDDVKLETRYLGDKGLVNKMDKVISPENVALRINAAGRDYLAEKGLA